jgi:hypothetical protein
MTTLALSCNTIWHKYREAIPAETAADSRLDSGIGIQQGQVGQHLDVMLWANIST